MLSFKRGFRSGRSPRTTLVPLYYWIVNSCFFDNIFHRRDVERRDLFILFLALRSLHPPLCRGRIKKRLCVSLRPQRLCGAFFLLSVTASRLRLVLSGATLPRYRLPARG